MVPRGWSDDGTETKYLWTSSDLIPHYQRRTRPTGRGGRRAGGRRASAESRGQPGPGPRFRSGFRSP